MKNEKDMTLVERVKVTIDLFLDECACKILADPNDRSRYAGYKRHAGHCYQCKMAEFLKEGLELEAKTKSSKKNKKTNLTQEP